MNIFQMKLKEYRSQTNNMFRQDVISKDIFRLYYK